MKFKLESKKEKKLKKRSKKLYIHIMIKQINQHFTKKKRKEKKRKTDYFFQDLRIHNNK